MDHPADAEQNRSNAHRADIHHSMARFSRTTSLLSDFALRKAPQRQHLEDQALGRGPANINEKVELDPAHRVSAAAFDQCDNTDAQA
jgi:hypothetical protein